MFVVTWEIGAITSVTVGMVHLRGLHLKINVLVVILFSKLIYFLWSIFICITSMLVMEWIKI